jgi:hypothetical protein
MNLIAGDFLNSPQLGDFFDFTQPGMEIVMGRNHKLLSSQSFLG